MPKKNLTIPITNKSPEIDEILDCFFENSSVPLSVTRISGEVYPNDALCRLLGYSHEELASKQWKDITHPADIELTRNQIKKLKDNEATSVQFVKRYIKKDGTPVWAEISTTLYRTKSFSEDFYLTTLIDATARMEYEQNLERIKQLLYTFIDSSQDMIFLKDEHYQYIFGNKALSQASQIPLNKFRGLTDDDFMDEAGASLCRQSDDRALKNHETFATVEPMEGKYFETRKFPVPIGGGKTGVGAYIRDVTEDTLRVELIKKISETNRIITECMIRPFQGIQEQLDFALNEAIEFTESQYGYIYLYNEGTKEFTLNSWSMGVMEQCAVADKQTKYPLEKTGRWGDVVRQRKPIIFNDFPNSDPPPQGYPAGHVKIENFISIPLFDNNQIVAVVGLANKKTDYDLSDRDAMTALMSGVWMAVERKEQQQANEQLLERTQAMINEHEAVMLLIEPNTGLVIEANRAAVAFYGYTREELLTMKIQDINLMEDKEIDRLCQQTLKSGQKYFTFPHRLKNGEIRMVDVYSCPIQYDGRKVLFSIIFDVTAREEMQKQNQYLAAHDYLTGSFNRRYFDETFKEMNNEDHYPLAIIMGDVNGLKLYNDSYGHIAGDRALTDVAKRIQKSVGPRDVVARLAGDEFAIIIPRTNEGTIRKKLDELSNSVNHTLTAEDKNALTISFGYGIQRKPEDSMDTLLKEAEAYMYNRKYYDRKSSRSNTVSTIMKTLFAKSEREEQHSQRVGVLTEALTDKLGLDDITVDMIRTAGFLHDIGKIGIDESILNKNGKLDKSEWEIMKLHSAKGADILERTVDYAEIANIVLAHHERFDGEGYPNGLVGEDIPLGARIIAIADSYDAMTNERSYRKPMSRSDAILELRKCAGKQHDPAIVEVFIKDVALSEGAHPGKDQPQ